MVVREVRRAHELASYPKVVEHLTRREAFLPPTDATSRITGSLQ